MNPRELGALEKRLEKEPGNLSLRVTVAGHLRDAGRTAEAVELYRSVAIAYQAQGRKQQAIAVCRSVIELAPEDAAIRALLAELTDPTTPPPMPGILARVAAQPAAAGTIPPHDSTTPLPKPLPYHVHDPTTSSVKRVSRRDVDLPPVEGADTRPGDEDRGSDTTGLAEAARQISGLIAGDSVPLSRTHSNVVRLNAADPVPAPREADVVTATHDGSDVTGEPITATRDFPAGGSRGNGEFPAGGSRGNGDFPAGGSRGNGEFDDAPTPTPLRPTPQPSRDTDEDLTTPREKQIGEEPVLNAFFTALPAAKRDAALQRCTQRTLAAGDVAIRAGETAHPLWLVVSGRLEVRANTTVLDSIEPGSFIGEAALLARTPAPHAVVAAVESIVLAVVPHVLFELASANPALWAQLKEHAERRSRLYAQRLAQR